QEQLRGRPPQLVQRIPSKISHYQLIFGQEAFVRAGRRAQEPPRPEPAGEIAFAAVDQLPRVEALADLDHCEAGGALCGVLIAVHQPNSRAEESTTLAAPGRPSVRVITPAVSRSDASWRTVGLRAPVRITSRTRSNCRPSAPPGCSEANCSGENPRRCCTAIASASPIARSATVDAVGAR